MGMNTALKNRQILENAYGVLGIEFMAAAQALDFRDFTPGKGVQRRQGRDPQARRPPRRRPAALPGPQRDGRPGRVRRDPGRGRGRGRPARLSPRASAAKAAGRPAGPAGFTRTGPRSDRLPPGHWRGEWTRQTVHAQLEEAGLTVGPVHRNLPGARADGPLARPPARASSPPTARSSSRPASARAARRPTATSSTSRRPTASPGAAPTSRARRSSSSGSSGARASYLRRREVYVFDGFVGAEPTYRMPIRVVADATWHALFAHTLFVRPEPIDLEDFVPGFTVIECGELPADEAPRRGRRARVRRRRRPASRRPRSSSASPSSAASCSSSARMYGGEMKKALFTRHELPAARARRAADALLGDGRAPRATSPSTSASPAPARRRCRADPARRLIGDDEHGWSDHGVFNFEGGCYAKVIRLSARAEPQIFQAIRFGSVLENVVVDPLTRAIDWDDDSITENTRATYPVSHIPDAIATGAGGTPRNVFFLACDAYGVLPPIARLTPGDGELPLPLRLHRQGRRHGGRASTSRSRPSRPASARRSCRATRSCTRTCWPSACARGPTQCWLVNTGWTGGPYGVGQAHAHRRSRATCSRRRSRARSTT